MKKTIVILVLFTLVLNGCASPSAQQATSGQATPVPLNSSNTATSSEITATRTTAPVQTASPSPAPTLTPAAAIPAGISAENFTNLAVTTQYLAGLKKAVKDLKDFYSLDALASSPDGRYVAIGGCTDGYRFSCPNSVYNNHSFLVILDAVTAKVISILPENDTTITGLGFSSDSSQLIYATYPQRVVIWDIPAQKVVKNLFRDDQSHTKIRMSLNPNGKTIAVSSATKLTIFEIASGKALKEIPATGFTPSYSADGSRLAMSSNADGSEITVYDTGSWQEVCRIQVPDVSTSGYSLDLSPDGKWIVTKPGSGQPVVRVWDAKTGQQVKVLAEPSGDVLSIAFSPNNQLLFVSVYSDVDMVSEISVWDVNTWQQLGVINNLTQNGWLNFSPTGEFMLASNGADIWRWSPIDEQVVRSRQAAVDFFTALSRGDYAAAAALYQPGQYEIKNLKSIGLDTSNTTSLLEQVCAGKTRICLPVLKVLPGGGMSPPDEYEVFVQFQAADGSPFKDAYGTTDYYLFLQMDPQQNFKVDFIPYNE